MTINGKFIKSETIDLSSQSFRLSCIQTQMDSVAMKISSKYSQLKYLKNYANQLLGKGVSKKIKDTIKVEVPGTKDHSKVEIILEYTIPDFIPKDATLMCKQKDKLIWTPLSRVQFFNLIRGVKKDIKELDREYSKLSKSYNELKANPNARRDELEKLKQERLSEIAEIDRELEAIK